MGTLALMLIRILSRRFIKVDPPGRPVVCDVNWTQARATGFRDAGRSEFQRSAGDYFLVGLP